MVSRAAVTPRIPFKGGRGWGDLPKVGKRRKKEFHFVCHQVWGLKGGGGLFRFNFPIGENMFGQW